MMCQTLKPFISFVQSSGCVRSRFCKIKCLSFIIFALLKHTHKRSLQNMFCRFSDWRAFVITNHTLFFQLYFIATGLPVKGVHSITQPPDAREDSVELKWRVVYKLQKHSNTCCLHEHFRRVVTLLECSQDKWGKKEEHSYIQIKM